MRARDSGDGAPDTTSTGVHTQPAEPNLPPAVTRVHSRGWAQRTSKRGIWTGGALVLLYLLDLAALHIPVSADGATALLEGQTISSGNIALHGWALSLDSFWGIDALVYGVVVRIVGLHVDLLHFVPSLLALLVIVVGIAVAKEERRGLAGFAAALVVVGLIAFPSPDLANYLLQGPWHIGTALYCLLAFRALGSGRFGWQWLAAVALLAIGLLSDLLILTFGVLPCLAAGCVAMLRCRRWRAGLTSLSAAVASVAAALVIREILQGIGTFTIVNRNIVIKPAQIVANFGHLANRIAGLFGVADIPLGQLTNGPAAERLVHLIGLVLVLGSLIAIVLMLVRAILFPRTTATEQSPRSWRVDDLLLFAIVGDLGTFVTSSANGHVEFVKYLTPGVIFAVVLCARVLGRYLDGLASQQTRHVIVCAIALLAALFGAFFISNLSRTNPVQPTQQVASFLVIHHLTSGAGDYPSSSLITVDTGGAVNVRPVATTGAGHLVRFSRQSTTAWYRSKRFSFLVYNDVHPWHGVDLHSATATFGAPTTTYHLGDYRVLVWSHPFTVDLGSPNYGSPLNIHW